MNCHLFFAKRYSPDQFIFEIYGNKITIGSIAFKAKGTIYFQLFL
jgi:hypothetical protein